MKTNAFRFLRRQDVRLLAAGLARENPHLAFQASRERRMPEEMNICPATRAGNLPRLGDASLGDGGRFGMAPPQPPTTTGTEEYRERPHTVLKQFRQAARRQRATKTPGITPGPQRYFSKCQLWHSSGFDLDLLCGLLCLGLLGKGHRKYAFLEACFDFIRVDRFGHVEAAFE